MSLNTSRDVNVPPTPPPLPNFMRRNIEKKVEQYPRKVKLILPDPGETSTDQPFDVAVALKDSKEGNTRKVDGSSEPERSIVNVLILEIRRFLRKFFQEEDQLKTED